MKTLLGFLCILCLCCTSMAMAQTTKGRAKVDPNKKWELINDTTGQVLASCDALQCEVSDQLKRMIVCHDRMREAMVAMDMLHTELSKLNPHVRSMAKDVEDQAWIDWSTAMQECVTTK